MLRTSYEIATSSSIECGYKVISIPTLDPLLPSQSYSFGANGSILLDLCAKASAMGDRSRQELSKQMLAPNHSHPPLC